MKKIVICLLMAVALLGAQKAVAQFRYGPMLGVNVTNMDFKQDLITVDKSVGFSAGVVGEMIFPGAGFGINTGLFYSQRGASLHLGEREIWASQGYGKERVYIHYVEIPFHLRFKYTKLNGVENTIAPFIYAGPTFGIKIASGNVDAMEYPDGDFAITAGIGAEVLRHWQVSCEYNWGMSYEAKTVLLTNFSARNRSLSVKVSYLF